MSINSTNKPFFHPYCTISDNSLPCCPVHPLKKCFSLCDGLNEKFKKNDFHNLVLNEKIAISCHYRFIGHTSLILDPLFFTSNFPTPPHLKNVVRKYRDDNVEIVGRSHKSVTIEDVSYAYSVIRIDETHSKGDILYCTAIHELQHFSDEFFPEKEDLFGSLFDRFGKYSFKLGRIRFYKFRWLFFFFPLLASIFIFNFYPILTNLRDFFSILFFFTKIVLILMLPFILYDSIFDMIYAIHDGFIDKKAISFLSKYPSIDTSFLHKRITELYFYKIPKSLCKIFLILLFGIFQLSFPLLVLVTD